MSQTQPPERLYHYTSAAGALGILHGQSIWASMVHYMNDGQEFKYALGLVREMLLHEAGPGGRDTPSTVICEQFLTVIRRFAIYAFSLSKEDDLLSQWRAYCPPAGGYALGFSTERLCCLAEPEGFQLVRCIYDRDEQRALLRPVVEEMLQAARELGPEGRGIDLHPSITLSLAQVGAALKHPSFEEEREWRLIATHVPSNRVRFRPAGSLIVPYCDLSTVGGGSSPVERIIVGPHPHAELAERSLRLVTSATRGWPVKVECSATPFRPLG